MEDFWKVTSSLKQFKSCSTKLKNSPARKRILEDTPKRNIIIISKSPSYKEINRVITKTGHSTIESPKANKSQYIFKPHTKVYVELSSSPIPYDLKSKKLQKDFESLDNLLGYQKRKQKFEEMRKYFKNLSKKEIKKVVSDRRDLHDINFINHRPHAFAKEYFREIRSGNTESVISLLIKYPELIREIDSTQQTGLHWACRRKNIELVKYLISSNANCMAKDIVGRKPEDIARKKKFEEITGYLTAFRRRSGQHVSRINKDIDEIPQNNLLHSLLRMQTRTNKNLLGL